MRVEVMTISLNRYSTDEEKEAKAWRLTEFCQKAEQVETFKGITEHHSELTVFAFFKE